MIDLYFFLKCLVMTVVLILLLQIKIGDRTLEDKALIYFRGSEFSEPLDKIAKGGAKVVQSSLRSLKSKIKSGLSDEEESQKLEGQSSAKNSEDSSKKKSSGFRFNWN